MTKTKKSPDDLMTPTEAARVLGMSSDNVRILANNGKLPALKTTNGRRLFTRKDVNELAKARAARAS